MKKSKSFLFTSTILCMLMTSSFATQVTCPPDISKLSLKGNPLRTEPKKFNNEYIVWAIEGHDLHNGILRDSEISEFKNPTLHGNVCIYKNNENNSLHLSYTLINDYISSSCYPRGSEACPPDYPG